MNPDKQLRALAEAEGWGILRFTTRVRAPIHTRRGARMGALAFAGAVAANTLRRRRSRR